ncbi:membrane exported protein [Hoylesella timonensis]|uniref:membrane exported protein n=1 Tax=Hoylesella timonensis TaxID=386414 RepID=UPI000586C8E1|nr:membrane exported protein [Hoylesella timonensis]
MNLIKKNFIILLISIVWCLGLHAQIGVQQRLDSVGIFIGQQINMTIDVTAPKNATIHFPALKPSHYLVPGVEILEISNGDTTALDNGFVKVSKQYTLTSFDEHLYAIPGQKVQVNGKDYVGNTLALKVVTVDVDTLHPNQFFPPKDVQDNPFSWKEWSPIFWLSVLMLLLCVLGFYLYLRIYNNKPIITRIRIIKKIPPHQKALTAIDKLKSERMVSSPDQKTYYTELTDTLRQYIEERFGFSAMEMTTTEIIYTLHKKGDKKMIDELKSLFETADLVKFAKYETLTNENDKNLVNAINFIDQTKIEGEPTEERIVPKLDEKDRRTQKTRKTIKMLLTAIGISVFALLIYIVYQVYLLMV